MTKLTLFKTLGQIILTYGKPITSRQKELKFSLSNQNSCVFILLHSTYGIQGATCRITEYSTAGNLRVKEEFTLRIVSDSKQIVEIRSFSNQIPKSKNQEVTKKLNFYLKEFRKNEDSFKIKNLLKITQL